MSVIQQYALSPYGNVMAAREVGDQIYDRAYKIANCVSLGIQPAANFSTLPGAEIATIGKTVASITSRGDTTFAMTCNMFNEHNTALALFGTKSIYAGGVVSETGVPVDLGGGSGNLPHPNVDTTSLVAKTLSITVTSGTGFTIGEEIQDANGMVFGVLTNVVTNTLTVYLYVSGYAPAIGDVVTEGVDSSDVTGVTPADVALTETTDFLYNTNLNNDFHAATGGVLDGLGGVVLGYDHTESAGVQINIGALDSVRLKIWVHQKNLAGASVLLGTLNRVTLAPNAVYSLIQASTSAGQAPDFNSQSFGGTVDSVEGLVDYLRIAV